MVNFFSRTIFDDMLALSPYLTSNIVGKIAGNIDNMASNMVGFSTLLLATLIIIQFDGNLMSNIAGHVGDYSTIWLERLLIIQ